MTDACEVKWCSASPLSHPKATESCHVCFVLVNMKTPHYVVESATRTAIVCSDCALQVALAGQLL